MGGGVRMNATAVVAAGLAAAGIVLAAAPAAGLDPPTYTLAQAKRGEEVFRGHCSEQCHGLNLDGGDVPPLKGKPFKDHWGAGGLDALFMQMFTKMPAPAPGTLTPEMYADVLAFILNRNGVPPGTTELPADVEKLASMAAPHN